MSNQQQVTFNESENAEIEYEEEALDEDPEVYHQFLTLTDGVIGSLGLLQADMDNFLYFKDELMQQLLPPNVLLQLSMISGKLYRSYSDLQFPLWELIRLVRVYSSPWEQKKEALQKMHEDYARKKSQLEVALRRLTTQDADVKRAGRERRVMNWEKLFCRVQVAKGHGRRWKFRMQDFKKRAAMGVENLSRYFAEDQSDLESEVEDDAEETPVDDGAAEAEVEADDEAQAKLELEEKTAEAAQLVTEEFPEIELESLSDLGGGDDQEVLEELLPPAPVVEAPPPVETADAEVWTHEPEFARFLHLRVYPARQVKAKQVTVQVAFSDASASDEDSTTKWVSLDAQDVAERAADEKRRMPRKRQAGAPADADDAAASGAGAAFVTASFPLPDEAAVRPPSLRLSVLNERMDRIGDVILTLSQLTELQLLTLDVPPPGEQPEESGHDDRSILDELRPLEYPMLLNDIEAGQLPMVIYWTQYPLHRTADRDNNTASVYELVEDLTGIDLNKITREELTREKIDACMSPRPMTPQPENVPKEEFDKLNEEFSEKFSQLEQDYIKKLKDLEAQLSSSSNKDNKSRQSTPPSQPQTKPAETRDRATSAQRSLLGSRGGRRTPNADDLGSHPVENDFGSVGAAGGGVPAPARKAGIRLPPRTVRPKKNFMIGRPLPAWGEGFPEDFFERMELIGHVTKEHKARLVERIRAEIAREVEAQLMELSHLASEAATADAEDGDADEAQQSDEVTIPALFMPQRGERKVYNPRAHLYFQPHGLKGARFTQPPSMLSLPPLPNRPSILNLFDLSTRASHPSGANATISVGVPPQNLGIQAQLNQMKKATN